MLLDPESCLRVTVNGMDGGAASDDDEQHDEAHKKGLERVQFPPASISRIEDGTAKRAHIDECGHDGAVGATMRRMSEHPAHVSAGTRAPS